MPDTKLVFKLTEFVSAKAEIAETVSAAVRVIVMV